MQENEIILECRIMKYSLNYLMYCLYAKVWKKYDTMDIFMLFYVTSSNVHVQVSEGAIRRGYYIIVEINPCLGAMSNLTCLGGASLGLYALQFHMVMSMTDNLG